MPTHADDYSKHFDPDYKLPDPPPAEEMSPTTRMVFGWTVQATGIAMLIFAVMNMTLAAMNGSLAPPYGGNIREGLPTIALAISGMGWLVAGFGIRRSSLTAAAIGGLVGIVSGFFCTPMSW